MALLCCPTMALQINNYSSRFNFIILRMIVFWFFDHAIVHHLQANKRHRAEAAAGNNSSTNGKNRLAINPFRGRKKSETIYIGCPEKSKSQKNSEYPFEHNQ
jgi:hypothetical protein